MLNLLKKFLLDFLMRMKNFHVQDFNFSLDRLHIVLEIHDMFGQG